MSAPADPVVAMEARWVLPVEPDRVVLSDHTVLAAGSVIRDVLPTAAAKRALPPPSGCRCPTTCSCLGS